MAYKMHEHVINHIKNMYVIKTFNKTINVELGALKVFLILQPFEKSVILNLLRQATTVFYAGTGSGLVGPTNP